MKNIILESETVDVNCMIGRGIDVSYKFETAGELSEYLAKYHISRAVVSSFMALNWNLKDGNKQLFDGTEKFRNLIPCPILSPHLGTSELPGAGKLGSILKQQRISAVKLYPATGGYPFNKFYAGKLLEILDELKIPVLIEWDEAGALTLPEVSAEFPNIPFILLFAGFRKSRMMYPLLEKRKNIFFDTSRFADYKILEEIVKLFGAERLLFGTGMSRFNPGPSMSLICLADISIKEKKQILSGNWKRLEGGIKWA